MGPLLGEVDTCWFFIHGRSPRGKGPPATLPEKGKAGVSVSRDRSERLKDGPRTHRSSWRCPAGVGGMGFDSRVRRISRAQGEQISEPFTKCASVHAELPQQLHASFMLVVSAMGRLHLPQLR
jgi:hypothetical protein